MRSWLRWLACFVLATVLWIGTLHLWFASAPADVLPAMARRQLSLWEPDGAGELERVTRVLRSTNPEWDLMARMFSVLAFANLALAEPAQQERYVRAIDRIVDRTEREVEDLGPLQFLLPYGRDRPFIDAQQRSLFVDGELALMMAVRQLVQFDEARADRTRRWIGRVIDEIEDAPVLLGESYPDEVWLFCNTVALAAIRVNDHNERTPARHRELFRRWVASAREHVLDPSTGILAAKTGYDGTIREGAEGSTVWLAASMLRLVDDDFARDQYRRARSALGRDLAGFGWAREWPANAPSSDDVDSGPTVPIVGANAGSSGLALVAASAFGDREFARSLTTSLGFAGFPIDGGAQFAAGNHLADSVITYALASGPVWDRVMKSGAPP